MTPQSDVVVWLEGYWPGLRDELGGKAAGLGAMLSAGLPVPAGFAVTTTAYRQVADAGNLSRLWRSTSVASTRPTPRG